MNKPWKLVLLLVGIFLAGGVTGAFVMMRIGRNLISGRPMPDQWAPMHLKRLAEKLELKPEQVEELRPIVKANMEELGRMRTRSMAESKVVFERMQREIEAKLTPEQRVKFDQMNKEMRERARKFMGPGRPGGPGDHGDHGPGDHGGSPGPGSEGGHLPPPDEKPAKD
jgi:uncharacterized membrane protein